MRTGIHSGIPRSAHRNNAGFSPLSLGEVKSWFKGDAAVYTDVDSLVVDNIPDQGTIGGQFNCVTNNCAVAVGVSDKKAPIFRGFRRMLSSSAASSWIFLHDGTSDASVTVRFYLYEIVFDSRIATNQVGFNDIGFSWAIETSAVRIYIGNGVANLSLLTPGANLTVGWNTLSIRKSGATINTSLNGGSEATGAIPTPSSSAPAVAPTMGNYVGGGFSIKGLLAECTIHGVDIGTPGVVQMNAYVAGRWSAAPNFSFLQFNGVDVIQHIDMDLGVTLSAGISAVGDQSGYNNNVVESTNKPAQVVDDAEFTNHDTADFDGVNDMLRIAAFTGGGLTQPYVMACCGTWDFDTPTGPFVYANSQASAGIRHQDGRPTLTAGSNANMTASAPSSGTVFSMYAKFNGASSQGVIDVNGVATETDTLNPGTSILSGTTLGAGGTGGSYWDGKFALGVVLSGAPSDADRDLLIDQLNTRAGITPL